VTTALITHADCLKHEMGPHHPECPERLTSVLAALQPLKLIEIEAPLVERVRLEATHSPEYVRHIFDSAPGAGYAMLDPDTMMNPHTLNATRRAAGAVIEAVDRVMAGDINNVFCAVRPCGHHATYDSAMGFCIFNNVAVGAVHALESHGLERVAILDFDVHHGNGTEDIFHDDPRVMLCSSFQHPYYPGSGADSGNDHIIATPLAAYSNGAIFRAAIEATWFPALERFKPQFIFISAGFDAHADDPLAQLQLHEDDYVWITEKIVDLARRHAQSRIVSVLEGGYNLDALGRCAAAHVGVLMR
jgi:acetoin utilization deacetylase AcuC-like enzyme